ncbi:hypothetical protein LLEC1_01061 [Akanthomyces lecanii]|uniref:Uncharacterized protein n=1 Tax=Cordyceps confragosa TaxID=2714763 RepID=A0A179ICC8_CORDF|nr:hypothetical protein LLEC1_01061 [Akanthomyces lecanii]
MKSTAAAVVAVTLAGFASACSTPGNYIVTFYGYPDNDPPGPAIAYDCGRGSRAGGKGTYDDPVTIATAPGELNKCEIVYLPFLTKYGRVEDYCAQCGKLTSHFSQSHSDFLEAKVLTATASKIDSDWKHGQPHIDIWTGSSSQNGGQAQIDCENRLTPGGRYSIVRNPPKNYGVNAAPLFSPPNTCNTKNVYPNNPAHC